MRERRKRDASFLYENCHQSSFEYSTCLYEKKPSHVAPAMTTAIMTSQDGLSGCWSSEDLR
jgi:hypothetical protein